MKIKQFEIWIADLNPKMGTEPGKARPVIIVQTDLLNKEHPSTIICPITTQVNPESEILRVHLQKSRFGLKQDCDVMMDQMRSIDRRRLVKRIGEVDRPTRVRMMDSLRIVLDL
jgi:mRNA interferase MazF